MTGKADEQLPRFPGFREMAQRRRRVIDELVAARRAGGLSQTVVAARMGTSQSVIGRLESGTIDVRLSTLERYAAAVGRDLEVRLPPAEGTSDDAGS
jgi:transcriptional regulator with XRE-family HTH domain